MWRTPTDLQFQSYYGREEMKNNRSEWCSGKALAKLYHFLFLPLEFIFCAVQKRVKYTYNGAVSCLRSQVCSFLSPLWAVWFINWNASPHSTTRVLNASALPLRVIHPPATLFHGWWITLSFIHLLAAGQDNAEGIGPAVERYNKNWNASPTSTCEKDKLWRGANPWPMVLNASALPLPHADLQFLVSSMWYMIDKLKRVAYVDVWKRERVGGAWTHDLWFWGPAPYHYTTPTWCISSPLFDNIMFFAFSSIILSQRGEKYNRSEWCRG